MIRSFSLMTCMTLKAWHLKRVRVFLHTAVGLRQFSHFNELKFKVICNVWFEVHCVTVNCVLLFLSFNCDRNLNTGRFALNWLFVFRVI